MRIISLWIAPGSPDETVGNKSTYFTCVALICVRWTQPWASGLQVPDYQDGYSERVADWIDCITKYQIFQALMSVCTHDQQVRLYFPRIADDLFLGIGRVDYLRLYIDRFRPEGMDDLVQISLPRLHLGRRR